jgi:hypothetical protein
MIDGVISTFKGSYTLIPVLVVFAIFALFLDSKIQEYEAEGKDYIKIGIIVAFVSWIAIFINTGAFTEVADDIIAGNPPF